MLLYYVILIAILCLLLKYNNPSITNKNLCVCLCLAIVLLFILTKIADYVVIKSLKPSTVETKQEIKVSITEEKPIQAEQPVQPEQPIQAEIPVKRQCGMHHVDEKNDSKIPQPYTLSSVNEDYILTGGMDYDLNNPKYPLLEKNQDLTSFPASFGEIEYILDKYKENGENRYYSVYYNIPKNMSFDKIDELMDLNKKRSLIQQSPLI